MSSRCSVRTLSGRTMASQRLCLRFLGLAVMLTFMAFRDVSSNSSLLRILKKRDVAGAASAPSRASVAVPSSKALAFLGKVSRTKRNLWDRSRPDVQQWIAQFMSMGFDEQVGCGALGGARPPSEITNPLRRSLGENKTHTHTHTAETLGVVC
uniref:ECRG4 augurin precursor a n=1 Tax=Gasterosteus aculeatus aculeatus TaxID=481459 RepID=A0AAQ4NZP8_GASAC